MITIEKAELHHIYLPYVTPFETSFARETGRATFLLALHGGGHVGWSECVASLGPGYSAETIASCQFIVEEYLLPEIVGKSISEPGEVPQRFKHIRGNTMAQATVENAMWDLLARVKGISLQEMLGGTAKEIAVGVSVGIEATLEKQLAMIEGFIGDGYGRIKLKIKPGWDVQVVKAVRERWPDILFQVDANSAYTLDQIDVFKELDKFNLLLIEQPFHYEDMVDHARLQAEIETPVCLDETIHSFNHARWALDINACKIINIKVSRVGGFTAAKEIHDLCEAKGIPVWCGGMLESNIGRAGNVALSSLSNFTLPADVSASARYFHQDVATPNFVLNDNSTITVPTAPGTGVEVDMDFVTSIRSAHQVHRAK